MWRRWLIEVDLKRQLDVERAARRLDLETFDRRTRRWFDYACALQQHCVEQGLLAPWKAAADRGHMPFVDSDAAPL